ncbi:CDGSH iron-sulfur domain-containing protein [Streptomyces echinatus]|uniref:CDGSH iron-sulfur domain-containing protein n=1 Tax=Streptomyces echinatus TaxID=67293 RepID=UPI0037BB3A38
MPNDPADSEPNGPGPSAPDDRAGRARRITVQRRGPLLVEGPVEVELEDGTTVFSDRFRVALCTCRRSRRFPWCDTSHRRKG